ncbi:major facilitator superfamily domain-containing protein [Xylariales sp. PMI_506]|nr:major facilitator superfamily domain-containing protein [Xylariales sp. PMI_506]
MVSDALNSRGSQDASYTTTSAPLIVDSVSGGEGRNSLRLGDAERRALGLGDLEAYELQDRGSVGNAEEEEEEEDVDHPHLEVLSARRLSGSTVASFQLYTPDEENAVIRKFDRRLVLFLSLCYVLSFLDRSNIGNARLAGMEQDLQTTPPNDEWYEWSLAAFYVAYIVFEWMSLLFRIIPAHIYISVIVLSWGITASLQSIATSYPFLVVLRFLLGIGEAGFTGVPFYLSFFFKRDELAFRIALFISAAPLATSFASSIAWVILQLGKNSPIAPWRLLFLLEGFPSVIVAVIAWSVIPDSPQTASYLTAREKKVARLRLRHEKPRTQHVTGTATKCRTLQPKELASVLVDPKAWLTAVMFFLTNMAYSSLPVFLPTILREMGHSALESQALSAPPYLIAFGAVLLTAHVSDRMRSRAVFILVHALVSAGGYAVLALARPWNISPMLRYLAIYPAATGFFNVVVLILAWSINNQPTESRQGGGFALLQVVGQCGPLVGTRLYPKRDEPFFEHGMWVCAGAMAAVAALTLLLRGYLGRQNRKLALAESERDGEEEEGLVQLTRAGRESTNRFRFTL